MPTVLALVGCGPRLEVGLTYGVAAPGLIALAGPTPRSELVMAAVDLLLRAASLRLADLSTVLATRGPGSFTGVRVTLATAQGLAMALGARAHGFSSLLVQAARTGVERCRAVQPARRGFVYVQAFARRNGGLAAVGEPAVEDVASLVASPLPVVAPDGFALPPGTPRASVECSAAEALLTLGAEAGVSDPSTLVPVYLESAPVTLPQRKG